MSQKIYFFILRVIKTRFSWQHKKYFEWIKFIFFSLHLSRKCHSGERRKSLNKSSRYKKSWYQRPFDLLHERNKRRSLIKAWENWIKEMKHADTYFFWRSIHQTFLLFPHSLVLLPTISQTTRKEEKQKREWWNFSVLRFIMKISFS